ncbi:MAG TPA: RdgB/HAM1 family non-canonical purine NTP pyrophosphatase [Flavipsychrobacter sp.]|nr:RdgB/HAM1 family non-canonical purine NTP pyrophosphatase [Flavipsychrobacter sp.]
MHELVIASNNSGKIQEIRALVGDISLLSLNDIGFHNEIEEPFHTFEQNALAKTEAVYQFCGKNVFADDSGLCVNALGGEPGVHSAYFGGLPRSDKNNNLKLLEALNGSIDRSAFYKAVLCLKWENEVYFFEGICRGSITEQPRGENGFGYDPLFLPESFDQTFAELALSTKNQLSHRGQAIKKMVAFLKDHTFRQS